MGVAQRQIVSCFLPGRPSVRLSPHQCVSMPHPLDHSTTPHPPPRGAEPGDSGDSIPQPLRSHLGRNELSSERRLHRRGEISPRNPIDGGPTPQAARPAQRGGTAGTGTEPITLEVLVIGLHLNQSGDREQKRRSNGEEADREFKLFRCFVAGIRIRVEA